MYNLLILAPIKEAVRMIENLLLHAAMLGTVEEVYAVTLPATREVAAQCGVAHRAICRAEHKLVAIEHLRHTTHCGKQRMRNLHKANITLADIADTVGIVVSGHNHHILQVVIYEVV